MTGDKQFLLVTLFHGTSFEEIVDPENANTHPFTRSEFNEEFVRFDLSGFRMVRTDQELFKSNYSMLTVEQIDHVLDSLQAEKEKKIGEFKKNFTEMLSEDKRIQKPDSAARHVTLPTGVAPAGPIPQGIAHGDASRANVLDLAVTMARSKKYYAESILSEIKNYDRPVPVLAVEWHKKFTLSLACLILFFVGAPLGAIIRKGGLGMPVVASVIIFVLYFVATIIGEKITKDEILPARIGMWIATALTLPLGVFLTSKATSDSVLFDSDVYLQPFRKLFARKK